MKLKYNEYYWVYYLAYCNQNFYDRVNLKTPVDMHSEIVQFTSFVIWMQDMQIYDLK
jgi:hypothetical protein